MGFALKTLILFQVQIKSKVAQSFAILCIFFILQNVAEFLAYFTYLESTALGLFFVHLYMVALYFMFPSILMLALTLGSYPHLRQAAMGLYGAAALLTLAHSAGLTIAGFEFLGWSVITLPGPLYWVTMGFIVACTLTTVAFLVYQNRNHKNHEVRYNCRVNLIAFVPLIAVAFCVLGLRLLGFNSSSSVSLPVATISFMFIMLLHTNGNLFWLSTKFKTLLAVMMMNRNSSVEDILIRIEKLRIEEALKVTRGEQKSAAKLIDIPPSTLNKKIARLNIQISNFSS
ncbi:MAG: hypothetical protein RLZZ385_986 [Pseudomonadota bacterium]